MFSNTIFIEVIKLESSNVFGRKFSSNYVVKENVKFTV